MDNNQINRLNDNIERIADALEFIAKSLKNVTDDNGLLVNNHKLTKEVSEIKELAKHIDSKNPMKY